MTLMENMHGKKVMNKKLFITPIVAQSPIKSAPSQPSESSSNHPPKPPPAPPAPLVMQKSCPLKLKTTRNLVPTIPKISMIPVVMVDDHPHMPASEPENVISVRKESVSEKRKYESPEKSDLTVTPDSGKSLNRKKKRSGKK